MILRMNLIRHGLTEGNKRKRYIGATDEPLCEEGASRLQGRVYPEAKVWFLSPMKRCLQTAELICQDPETEKVRWIIVDAFRECDFGEFENKNYMELSGSGAYQRWIDSNGTLPFPGGESPEAFRERSCRAFEEAAAQCFREKWDTANLVVHGGTIMSIMERYSPERKGYYEWHVENGGGYTVRIDQKRWEESRIISRYRELTGNAEDAWGYEE